MKRITQTIMMFACAIILFSSCNKVEEDTYFPAPKGRLTSIISQNNESYTFNYDKKFIKSIIMKDEDSRGTITVSYNDDDQICELQGDGSKIVIFYKDKKIARTSFYDEQINDGNNSVYEVVFTHNGDHISHVATYGEYDDLSKCCEKPLFGFCYNANLVRRAMKDAQKSNLHLVYVQMETDWTYYMEDNLLKTTTQQKVLGVTNTYTDTYTESMTYDDHINPLLGLPYPVMNFASYCANNIKSYIQTVQVENLEPMILSKINLDYTYNNNDYPNYISITNYGRPIDLINYTYAK